MIGPKCRHCRKQLKHHGKGRECPVGKRLGGAFTQFLPHQFFQPGEPVRKGSRKPAKSTRKNFAALRADGCCACGSKMNTEIHHVKTRGSGGSNHPRNLLPLCSGCHTQEPHAWHRSRKLFFSKFPHVMTLLETMGWTRLNDNDWHLHPPPEAHAAYLRNQKEVAIA